MISLKNINIIFGNKTVIKNSNISISKGQLTCITGESGSGKTTLLYMIGLISSITDYEYFYDNMKLDLSSDKAKSNFRKTEIGYIFQDNNLVNDITILENIRLASKISGRNIDEKALIEIIDYVHLSEIDLGAYPPNLSGGERQRLAIACALAKNSSILVADEPTSSLDVKNSNIIMSIFKKISADGKYVIIASHDPNIIAQADTVFIISNQEIGVQRALNKYETECDVKRISVSKLKLDFYFSYWKNTRNRNRGLNVVLVILCSVAITLLAITNSVGKIFLNEQNKNMNQISNRELFLVNLTTPLNNILDFDENLSISQEDMQKIESISGVEAAYPFYSFKSNGFDGKDFQGNGNIVVDTNGTKNTVFFDNIESETSFSVFPYFEHQNLDAKSLVVHEKKSNGVFISYELYTNLGKPSMENLALVFDIFVPVKQFSSTMEMNGSVYPIDLDICKKVNIARDVIGVLNENIKNEYTSNGQQIIYLESKEFYQILNENQASELQSNSDYPEKVVEPSSLIIVSKNFEVINVVKDRLIQVDPNYKVFSQFQDIKVMIKSINETKKAVDLILIIAIIILFSLMSIIYISKVEKRKIEISLLKANGLSKQQSRLLILFEAASTSLGIIILSSIMYLSLMLIILKMNISSLAIGSWIESLSLIFIVSILSVIAPTILGMKIINKYEPAKVLRN